MALIEGFSGFKQHVPVLHQEILDAFEPFQNKKDLRYFDGTFGRGGHYHLLLEKMGPFEAFVCDQDEAAIAFAKENFKTEVEAGRLRIHHGNYSDICEQDIGEFDMILLDLGVSSPQLDEAQRGFSFQNDGPL
ncbi:MAG: 16S rRNA (cytosine(1402)-N(4))-methyltransferase, partial [Bdellovibrionota bacterium]